jgi:hypothetical protein
VNSGWQAAGLIDARARRTPSFDWTSLSTLGYLSPMEFEKQGSLA